VAILETSARKTAPAVETLQQASQGLKEEYIGIKQSSKELAALVTGQQAAAGQLLEATKSLQEQASALETAKGGIDRIEESLAGQSRYLETMFQELSALKGRLEALITSLERAPAGLKPSSDEQVGSIHNGAQLAPNTEQPR
jgi:ABC-type transporter Mla subunit MlaD